MYSNRGQGKVKPYVTGYFKLKRPEHKFIHMKMLYTSLTDLNSALWPFSFLLIKGGPSIFNSILVVMNTCE